MSASVSTEGEVVDESATKQLDMKQEEDYEDDHSGAEDELKDEVNKFKRQREKRLAMNRASARERRKRKRILIEELQKKNYDLSKDNETLKGTNEQLRSQVEQLKTVLVAKRSAAASVEPSALSILQAAQSGAAAAAAVAAVNPLTTSKQAPGSLLFQAREMIQKPDGTSGSTIATNTNGSLLSGLAAAPAPSDLAQRQLLLESLQLQQRQRALLGGGALGSAPQNTQLLKDPIAAAFLANAANNATGANGLAGADLNFKNIMNNN
mmetsp:Transcript_17171/g.24167  ORF Transcript_17171/g.24167 Transcript_17171/m.24167 type:complete len:266 (-) Transcript_17171:111-908(-)